MSDSTRSGEKTEQPTPHRLREARRKGQIVKSNELNSAFNLLVVVLFFMLYGENLFRQFVNMLRSYLEEGLMLTVSSGSISAFSVSALLLYLKLAAPVFVTVIAAGLVINYAQVGFLLSTDSLSPKLENLNPIQGFKKIFSRKALFELAKALFKIILVGAVTYGFIRSRLESFLSFVYTTPAGLFAGFSREIYNLTLRVGVIFISLAVLDYLYQRYEFMKSMRMTKQEVKEEFKQLEGDPLIKSKLREKQRSMAGRRMMQEVPKATVVVTNPTDIAVALKYSEGETAAPKIVAKGAALIAARIREVAKEHGVPVVENKVVARFLYRHVEIGNEIPMELYQAVAEILALVYESKKRSR